MFSIILFMFIFSLFLYIYAINATFLTTKMFYILSKTVFYVLMPMFWIIFLLIFAIFTKNDKRRKKAIKICVVILFIFGNPALTNEAFLRWEIAPTPMASVGTYQVGIVLTGVLNVHKQPHDRTYFNKGADRITHALQLYKSGNIKKILISGGSFDPQRDEDEAQHLKNFLLLAGVPENAIILEDKSANTRENALFSAKILNKDFPNQKYLLITSAFHLRRSLGCFEKVGIKADGFATDFYNSDRKTINALSWLVPTEKSLYFSYILLHEWLGYAVYRIIGYSS